MASPQQPPSVKRVTREPRRFAAVSAAAFTLVELVVVLSIVVILTGLLVPAFTTIKSSRDITKAAYDIADLLEQARGHAMAYNTYVWVGFFEEDGAGTSTIPATAGTGRVVVSVVGSRDGTRYSTTAVDAVHPAAFGAGDVSNQVILTQLNKILKIEGIHVGTLNDASGTANVPKRPPVSAVYQMGDPSFGYSNPATFKYPLSGTAQYTFSKIIEFNPRGEASKIVDNLTNPPAHWLEIALQPARGNVVDKSYNVPYRAAAVIQVAGLAGRVEIYKP